MMWFTYCGASSEPVDVFLAAVEKYLTEQLGMSQEDASAVLSDEHREALKMAVDLDSEGKVRTVSHNPLRV